MAEPGRIKEIPEGELTAEQRKVIEDLVSRAWQGAHAL